MKACFFFIILIYMDVTGSLSIVVWAILISQNPCSDHELHEKMITMGCSTVPERTGIRCSQSEAKVQAGIFGYNADNEVKLHTSQDFLKENVTFINISLGFPFQLAQGVTKRLIQDQHVLLVPENMCNTMVSNFNQQRLEKSIICFRSSSPDLPSKPNYYLPIQQFKSGICHLLQILRWSQIHIFAEDNDAPLALTTVLKANGITSSSTLFNSSSSPDLQTMLWRVLGSVYPWHIMVLGRQEAVHHLLKEANAFDVRHGRRTDLRSASSWLVVMQEKNLGVFQNDSWLDNVAVVTLPVVNIRHVINANNAIEDQIGDIFTLMYRKHGREFEHIGRFHVNGTVDVNNNIFPNTQHGLNGRPFLTSTLRWAPYTYIRNESGRIVFEGICIDILKELSIVMNFTFKMIFPPDLEWGEKKSDGTWTGLVGQIERKEVDMTVAPLGQAFERRKVMDFSYPIGYDIGAGVYRLPDLEASRWQVYLQPLSLYVHLCLVISFMLLILLLYTTRHCPMATRGEEDVSDTWLLVFGLMIRQSLSVNQMRASSNILFSFICVFGAITSAIYCSNMIAFFTVSKQTVPFSTSEEMVQQNTYKWGTLGGSLWSDSFSVSKVPVHQSFWKSVINFNKSDSDVLHASELVHKRKVLAGKYVFVVESDILKTWLQDDCSLKLIPDVGFPMQYALGLPLHSPYTKTVSDWLIAFSERGLYDVWRRKWMPKDDSCSKQREVKVKTVTVIDLQGSFIVLGIGSCMAVVSLMSEIWWARVRDSKRQLT